jgi:hypothetical protein
MNITLKSVILAVFMTGAAAGQAQAIGNIHFGKLQVHPYLSLQEIFSDNVYSTAQNEKSDAIHVIKPGVQLFFPFGSHQFEADYHAVFRRYDTYRGEATDDQHARGSLDLSFGRRINLTLRALYDKGHEARSSSATGFIEVFRAKTGFASVVYQLTNRFKVQADYTRTAWSFPISGFRDRDEDLIAGYFYYRFLPKTWVFVEYDHLMVDYTESTTPLDNNADSLFVGLTWDVTAKTRGTIKAGGTRKDYDDGSVDDESTSVWGLDLDHKFTELTSLALRATRSVNETNAPFTANFITTGFSGELTHRFLSKAALLLRGAWGKDDFSHAVPPSTVKRSDKTTLLGAGLKYFAKEWLDLGVDYNRRSRSSNIAANEYDENEYILSVNMRF